MPLITKNRISDSIIIEHYGTEEQGMVAVIVDDNQRFETSYDAAHPCPNYETLALAAINNC